ncbi:MAG: hypothetical protein Q9219_007617, partial [cf. Caloplaca sp. 3 TL-2023]
DNGELAIILYAPDSEFDEEVLQKVRRGELVTIDNWSTSAEDSSSDSSKDDPDYQPRRSRSRTPGGSAGTDNSIFQRNVRPRVRNLGDSWILDYKTTISLTPVSPAVEGMRVFYRKVIDKVIEAELAKTTAESVKEMTFASGGLRLRLRSEQNIQWTWVVNLASGMMESLSGGHAVLYEAVAENVYWDIPAVGVTLSVV